MLCFGFLVIFQCSLPTQPAVSKASYCDVMQTAIGGPFRASPKDTLKTRQTADTINRAGKALCGWGVKK